MKSISLLCADVRALDSARDSAFLSQQMDQTFQEPPNGYKSSGAEMFSRSWFQLYVTEKQASAYSITGREKN